MIWVAAVARWGQWGVCKASVNVYLSSRPRWPCISVLQRAVELRPLDPVLHHMLGVWCFEVSNLGWVQRQLATALFGAPPTSTFEEALEHLQVTCVQVDASFLAHAAFPSSAELITLQRCEALACSPTSTTKPWMANRLKLAQTCIGTFAVLFPYCRNQLQLCLFLLLFCIALRRTDEARHWLEQAAALPVGPAEDAEALEQLAQLCKSHGVRCK
jgi:hypothetical protein